jgi:hypothetical protein
MSRNGSRDQARNEVRAAFRRLRRGLQPQMGIDGLVPAARFFARDQILARIDAISRGRFGAFAARPRPSPRAAIVESVCV